LTFFSVITKNNTLLRNF